MNLQETNIDTVYTSSKLRVTVLRGVYDGTKTRHWKMDL